MSDEDMIRRGDAKREGYRTCAETRHVTLGQKVETAILAIPAAQVTVKPLEWELRAGSHGPYYSAYDPLYGLDVEAPDEETCDAIDNNRAARIRSALAAQPSPDVAVLVALLAEARTDLAAYVDADWPEHQRSNYPPIQAKWKRDMELCWQIDAALASVKGGGK